MAENGKTDKDTLKLLELSAKELREKLVEEKGLDKEKVELFTSKDQMIFLLQSDEVGKVKSLEDKEDPEEKKSLDRRYRSKKDVMRDKLKNQERVRIKLPLEGKEKEGVVTNIGSLDKEEREKLGIRLDGKNGVDTVHVSGAIRPVTINGYTVHVPKGKYVNVPEQIADLLDYSDRETSRAGQDLLLERKDPETGKTVGESM